MSAYRKQGAIKVITPWLPAPPEEKKDKEGDSKEKMTKTRRGLVGVARGGMTQRTRISSSKEKDKSKGSTEKNKTEDAKKKGEKMEKR